MTANKTHTKSIVLENRLTKSRILNNILYAQCWEDPQIDREAFNTTSEDVIFCITSGGCNVLTFLIDNPKKIIALDINTSQNYLLELKIAAFRRLSYEEMLELFGVTYSFRRLQLYEEVKGELSVNCRSFWELNHGKLKHGLIYCGHYEKYMSMLRKWFTVLVGKRAISAMFCSEGRLQKEVIYKNLWENYRYREFTRLFLSRSLMNLFFTRSFFKYLEKSFSFGDHFRNQIKKGLLETPLKENYFIAFILLGKYFSLDHLPIYLRRENFKRIRKNIDRIEIVNKDCQQYFSEINDNTISKFNLSNIFEWMPFEEFENILKEIMRIGTDQAILTYRNLLVSRCRPQSLSKWILPETELSQRLHAKDLSFIYKRYVVERLLK